MVNDAVYETSRMDLPSDMAEHDVYDTKLDPRNIPYLDSMSVEYYAYSIPDTEDTVEPVNNQ
ncbi:hypothetical protein KIN20_017122 [Parelaphostrongylus tenuis]|uniref:Uncharacterized protein n=1 Tax=Parelaphostrongylus tenuis TaxID=148309 RepID=A0AAD5QR96_PARTN|nr:hypothetical protein KIN20_017122 [Parelaphostrongylus tenuis]